MVVGMWQTAVIGLVAGGLGTFIGLVLGFIGWNVKELIDEQIAQTIDTDIRGLSEQYSEGGIRQLVEVIQRRTRQPSASLYLVTTYAGMPIAGNVAALPEQVVDKSGLVEVSYQRAGESAPEVGREVAVDLFQAARATGLVHGVVLSSASGSAAEMARLLPALA